MSYKAGRSRGIYRYHIGKPRVKKPRMVVKEQTDTYKVKTPILDYEHSTTKVPRPTDAEQRRKWRRMKL